MVWSANIRMEKFMYRGARSRLNPTTSPTLLFALANELHALFLITIDPNYYSKLTRISKGRREGTSRRANPLPHVTLPYGLSLSAIVNMLSVH